MTGNTLRHCPSCGALQPARPSCGVCGQALPGGAEPGPTAPPGMARDVALAVLALLGGIVLCGALIVLALVTIL